MEQQQTRVISRIVLGIVAGITFLSSIALLVYFLIVGYLPADTYIVLLAFAALAFSFIGVYFYFTQYSVLKRQINALENWANLSKIRGELVKPEYGDVVSKQIVEIQSKLTTASNKDTHFDQVLRQNVLLDAETGIGNREYFSNRIAAFLKEEDVQGAVLIVHLNELSTVESLYGKQQKALLIDSVITATKRRLKHVGNYFIARRSGSELAILLPYVFLKESEKIANNLVSAIAKLPLPIGINNEDFVHIGISYFSEAEKPYQIMAEADMALRTAQLQGPSQWFMFEVGEIEQQGAKGALKWRTFLEKAINTNAFVIFFQPVIASKKDKILHHEVLTKVRDTNGALISARVFLPMAQKSGVIKQIDLIVFEQVCRILSYEANLDDDCSLNLSVESLTCEHFLENVKALLEHYPSVANKLIIELSEYQIVNHLNDILPALNKLNRSGIRILVDKVGQYIVSAEYLKLCPISYLKLHRSIVLDINNKAENQIFIQSLKTMAQNYGVDVYAAGIETYEEWYSLVRLGVQGGQGHLFTEPVEQVAKAIHLL